MEPVGVWKVCYRGGIVPRAAIAANVRNMRGESLKDGSLFISAFCLILFLLISFLLRLLKQIEDINWDYCVVLVKTSLPSLVLLGPLYGIHWPHRKTCQEASAHGLQDTHIR